MFASGKRAVVRKSRERVRSDRDNYSALVKVSKNKANPATEEVREENQSAILTE